MIYWILIGIFVAILIIMLIFSATSYGRMIRIYKKYDKEFVYCNATGFEFTDWAIDQLGLNTKIYLLDKELDECYLPKQDVVCISKHTAETSSVSSICIAAHELGHAVQNKNRTFVFTLQRFLNVVSKICAFFSPFLFIAGIVLLFIPEQLNLGTILVMSSLISLVTIFLLKIVTIPTEVQASRIAYDFLKENNVLEKAELRHGKKVLNAAIGTYIASLFVPILKFFKSIGRSFKR